MKDAPARWKERVTYELIRAGFRAAESDPCLFILDREEKTRQPKPTREEDIDLVEKSLQCQFTQGSPLAVISLHVDDTVIAAETSFYENQWKDISRRLKIGSMERAEDGFTFCDKRVAKENNDFVVSQHHYYTRIAPLKIPEGMKDTEPFQVLTDKGKCAYRAAIGALQWTVVNEVAVSE